MICGKVGRPDSADLSFVSSEKAKRFMLKMKSDPAPPLSAQFPGVRADALDLLGRMLRFVPDQRATVDEAIGHPFLADIHNPDDAPVAEKQFDFSFEDEELHRERLQELIWEEIGDFRPTCLGALNADQARSRK